MALITSGFVQNAQVFACLTASMMLKEGHGLSAKLLTDHYALTCLVLDVSAAQRGRQC